MRLELACGHRTKPMKRWLARWMCAPRKDGSRLGWCPSCKSNQMIVGNIVPS